MPPTVIHFLNRGVNLKCAQDWLEQIGAEEISSATDINNRVLKCQQRCERQSETAMFSSALFPVESAFSQHQFFCLALEKINKICQNPYRAKAFEEAYAQIGIKCNDIFNASITAKICSKNNRPNATMIKGNPNVTNFLYKYARKNLAVMRVFIKDPFHLLIRRDEQMSMISFLANAGGLLGLCMGFSLVSIFEIVYHLLNFVVDKIGKF